MKIAFSGHRKSYWRHPDVEEMTFVSKLQAYLSTIEKPYTFIVGGATGIDAFAARYAISNEIPFELHVPFPVTIHSHAQRREGATQEDAWFLLDQHKRCIKRVIIGYEYDVNNYFLRDQSMTNACDLLLCYYFKEASGTGKCVRYAKEIGKPVVNLRLWKG